jgi:hypothetical protein
MTGSAPQTELLDLWGSGVGVLGSIFLVLAALRSSSGPQRKIAARQVPFRLLFFPERRRLQRRLRDQAPVPAEELPVLRSVAYSNVVQRRGQIPSGIGTLLALTGASLHFRHSSIWLSLFATLLVIGLILTVLTERQARIGAAFLLRTQDDLNGR